MGLNEDLDYLQSPERTSAQRWGWLAGRLDKLDRNSENDFARLNNHEKQLDRIEKRCAGRRWQGKLLWGSLMASTGLFLDRIFNRFGGGV